jgi:hypothetical protein
VVFRNSLLYKPKNILLFRHNLPYSWVPMMYGPEVSSPQRVSSVWGWTPGFAPDQRPLDRRAIGVEADRLADG